MGSTPIQKTPQVCKFCKLPLDMTIFGASVMLLVLLQLLLLQKKITKDNLTSTSNMERLQMKMQLYISLLPCSTSSTQKMFYSNDFFSCKNLKKIVSCSQPLKTVFLATFSDTSFWNIQTSLCTSARTSCIWWSVILSVQKHC